VTGVLLVVNAGSSSVKFALYDADGARLAAGPRGQVDGIGAQPHVSVHAADGAALVDRDLPAAGFDHRGAIAAVREWLRGHAGAARLVAVGHRVVHGGRTYAEPVRIDAGVLSALERLIPLAPLHQPHHLAAIRAMAEAEPGVPQVAAFDTAFHRSQPVLAQRFALPRALEDEGVHRYGFHGLSYEYVASALPGVAPEIAGGRVVIAHLGNGASMCAIERGRSVATTMGLTALDGLVMGTRSGSIDPGVLLYLMDQHGMDARALEDLLYHRSGLLGVSGVSGDVRALLASPDPRAREALDLFVYRAGRELGSLAAALGGLDALVFTAGIGEHAVEVRAGICRQAGWLGVRLDEAANRAGGPRITLTGAPVSAWVIPTDENLMIARHTLAVVAGGPPAPASGRGGRG
jgi:acetate kinase